MLENYLDHVRPDSHNPSEYKSYSYAKATYVKSNKTWNLYWMRASGHWNLYEVDEPVDSLEEILRSVYEDKRHCFRG